jgi:hypothetical protein
VQEEHLRSAANGRAPETLVVPGGYPRALDAYCELYGAEAKLLQGVLTSTAESWWWDRSRCSHGPEVECSGPRGLPHLHFVLGHTTALEKAFARAFFEALKPAAYMQGLGHTSTYEWALLEQGKYEAGRLRHYIAKLARYLAKAEGAGEFLFQPSGERVFYVAPWLSALSGVTMTVARLSRRVWAARMGFCPMPKMTQEQEALVGRLIGRGRRLRRLHDDAPAPSRSGETGGRTHAHASEMDSSTGRWRSRRPWPWRCSPWGP